MSNKTIGLSKSVRDYILNVTVNENDSLKSLREETSKLEMGMMQISPEQGQFLSLLVNVMQAKRILEVGVFTGYSSICFAKELPSDGLLVACDTSEEWTNMAKKYWSQLNLSSKIQLQLAPAEQTLNNLISEGNNNSFDMAFIDADKPNYITYYNLCLELIKPGGVILVDNTLWGGSVANNEDTSESTVALRQLNELIAHDDRVRSSLLTIGDGLTIVYKK
jgi:predicted O-methyltransferase YrrM